MKISQKLIPGIVLAIILNVTLVVGSLYAQTITGKVVSVADGDTITVMEGTNQHRIRFYGIDCPESGQDFGARVKKFLSDMVFGKQVQVVQKDMDRYGRVVGMVYIDDTCVNQEIVRAGLAWVYHRYCKENVCQEWTNMEARARTAKIGLWSHPDPIPPWEYRRGARANSGSETVLPGAYHGNTSSHVFHQSSCKHFNCKNCTEVFESRKAAIKAGYRPCGGCRP